MMTILETPTHETLPRDEHLARVEHLERTAQALWSAEPTRSAQGRVELMLRLSAVSSRLERHRILLQFDHDSPIDATELRACGDELAELTIAWLPAPAESFGRAS